MICPPTLKDTVLTGRRQGRQTFCLQSKGQEDIIFEYGLLQEQAGLGGCPRGFLEQREGTIKTWRGQEWDPATGNGKEFFFTNVPTAQCTSIASTNASLCKVSPGISFSRRKECRHSLQRFCLLLFL